jgi:hypothetical protein
MWKHAIGQEFSRVVTYLVAFWQYHTSLILFFMFLVGWFNLITHPLLCPITLELTTSVPLTMNVNVDP